MHEVHHLPICFLEAGGSSEDLEKIDHYFLNKSQKISQPDLKALISKANGFSGFIALGKMQNGTKKTIKNEISPVKIAQIINQYKAPEKPDWLIAHENGFLTLNPELSDYLEESLESWIPFTEKSENYHTTVLLSRLAGLINLQYGFFHADQKLSQIESINYRDKITNLENYFSNIFIKIRSVQTELGNLGEAKFPILENIENYLSYFSGLDQALCSIDEHLDQLRFFENRFAFIESTIDIDLHDFYEVKSATIENLESVNILNQNLERVETELGRRTDDWTTLYSDLQPRILKKIVRTHHRYQSILQDPGRIEFYSRLNNPEREIKKELKTQKQNLSSRMRLVKWGKSCVDDQCKTLNATHILFQKLSQNTDDIKDKEIGKAFLDQDQLRAYLKKLAEFFANSHDQLEEVSHQEENESIEIDTKKHFAISDVSIKRNMLKHYLDILNAPEQSATEKLHKIKKCFANDRDTLERPNQQALNYQGEKLVKNIRGVFHQIKIFQNKAPFKESFKNNYRMFKLAQCKIEQAEIRQALLLSLYEHTEALTLTAQMSYYNNLIEIPEASRDAKMLGLYCQKQFAQPRVTLIKKIEKALKQNEQSLRLLQISEKMENLSALLIHLDHTTPNQCEKTLDSLVFAENEMHEFVESLNKDLCSPKVQKNHELYFQLIYFVQASVEIRQAFFEAEEAQNPYLIENLMNRLKAFELEIQEAQPNSGSASHFSFENPVILKRLQSVYKGLNKSVLELSHHRYINRFIHVKEEIKETRQFRRVNHLWFSMQEKILSVKSFLDRPIQENSLVFFQDIHPFLENASAAQKEQFFGQLNQSQIYRLYLFELMHYLEGSLFQLDSLEHGLSETFKTDLEAVKVSFIKSYERGLNRTEEGYFERIFFELRGDLEGIFHQHLAIIKDYVDEKNQTEETKSFIQWIKEVLSKIKESLFGKSQTTLEREEQEAEALLTLDGLSQVASSEFSSKLNFV